MLEAQSHIRLKHLLEGRGGSNWPHHLTLARLTARSLRRGDHSLFPISADCSEEWLLSLLLPVMLSSEPVVLLASTALQQRLIQRELPQLAAAGLQRPLWQGSSAPAGNGVWLISPNELVQVWQQGALGVHQLVCAEAEQLEELLRQAQAIRISPQDWDRLGRARPDLSQALLQLHERMSRRLLNRPLGRSPRLSIAPEEEAPLRLLLRGQVDLPEPWPQWLGSAGTSWTSWAITDPQLLQWTLERQPLLPLQSLSGLLLQRGAVLVGAWMPEGQRLHDLGLRQPVIVPLRDLQRQDALPLFAPPRQPLPNGQSFANHLLDQCRRLVLGQGGLSLVLVDDDPLRQWLTSALASEFGRRVDHEQTAPEVNGVICCRWGWWLEHQALLPQPCQLVACCLPIASLEDPLTAARVEAMRRTGRDWFREMLLPEALEKLQRAVAPLRRSGTGRLAVLDGRLRGRSWGQRVLEALEPWEPLEQLLPP
jgi:ATP-dependent DNA helicase DinG